MSKLEKITALKDDSNTELWKPIFGEETEGLLQRIFGFR